MIAGLLDSHRHRKGFDGGFRYARQEGVGLTAGMLVDTEIVIISGVDERRSESAE